MDVFVARHKRSLHQMMQDQQRRMLLNSITVTAGVPVYYSSAPHHHIVTNHVGCGGLHPQAIPHIPQHFLAPAPLPIPLPKSQVAQTENDSVSSLGSAGVEEGLLSASESNGNVQKQKQPQNEEERQEKEISADPPLPPVQAIFSTKPLSSDGPVNSLSDPVLKPNCSLEAYFPVDQKLAAAASMSYNHDKDMLTGASGLYNMKMNRRGRIRDHGEFLGNYEVASSADSIKRICNGGRSSDEDCSIRRSTSSFDKDHDQEADTADEPVCVRVPIKKRRVYAANFCPFPQGPICELELNQQRNNYQELFDPRFLAPSQGPAFTKLSNDAQLLAAALQGRNHSVAPVPIHPSKLVPSNVALVRRPTRLSLPSDKDNVNSLHVFVRSSLLEIFEVQADDQMTATQFRGKVGLRCVHCKHSSKNMQHTGAVFFPKNLKGLYRNVCTWQRVHFKGCSCIPDDVRKKYKELKEKDKSRGRTRYWETSAMDIGLVDVIGMHGRGGIMFG